jgi:transposase-like protein
LISFNNAAFSWARLLSGRSRQEGNCAPDQAQAQAGVDRLTKEWQECFPELVTWLEETIADPLALFQLPAEHRKQLRTTNSLER